MREKLPTGVSSAKVSNPEPAAKHAVEEVAESDLNIPAGIPPVYHQADSNSSSKSDIVAIPPISRESSSSSISKVVSSSEVSSLGYSREDVTYESRSKGGHGLLQLMSRLSHLSFARRTSKT
jgi:hypothetical protein